VWVCVNAHVDILVYVRENVLMYIYMYVDMHIHICIPAIYIHKYVQIHVVHLYIYTYAHRYIFSNWYIHITLAYIHALIYT